MSRFVAVAGGFALAPGARISLVIVGGTSERVARVALALRTMEGVEAEVCVCASDAELIMPRLSHAIDAVVCLDELAAERVLEGAGERQVPVVIVLEHAYERRVSTRIRYRRVGAAACLFDDEVSAATARLSICTAIELAHRSAQLNPPAPELSGLCSLERLLARIDSVVAHDHAQGGVLFIDASKVAEDERRGAVEVVALRDRVGQRLASICGAHLAARLDSGGYVVLVEQPTEDLLYPSVASIREQMKQPYLASGESGMSELELAFGYVACSDVGTGQAAVARAREAAEFDGAAAAPAPEESARTYAIGSQLACALEHDKFTVMYQPIVEMESRRPYGFEALIRWNHPDGEERAAASFIDAANDTNLIIPIGYWCLDAAMRQMAAWQSRFEGHNGLRISVNLAAPQVLDPLFAARVSSLLMTTGLAPDSVSFEIEAETIAEHRQAAGTLAEHLVGLGTRVWVEDFGLSCCTVDDLKGLPLDGFKIDRRFVSRIDGTPQGAARIQQGVTAARALGLRTLGEGIEHEQQADVLRWLGCTLGQGFLFSHPMDASDVADFLAVHG